jgi:hypothetical protein
MIEVGRAYLAIGEVVYDHPMAAARARRIFLSALFLGRGLRNVHAVADSAEALAVLGDHDLAARAFRIAVTLAQRGRDSQCPRPHHGSARSRAGAPERGAAALTSDG